MCLKPLDMATQRLELVLLALSRLDQVVEFGDGLEPWRAWKRNQRFEYNVCSPAQPLGLA